MIEILKAIILGIVEGITEWLPISSTGHIILVDEFLKMNVSEQFMSMFTVVIQLGAILAVVVIYWKKIFPFRKKEGKILVNKNKMIMWIKIVIACFVLSGVMYLFDTTPPSASGCDAIPRLGAYNASAWVCVK